MKRNLNESVLQAIDIMQTKQKAPLIRLSANAGDFVYEKLSIALAEIEQFPNPENYVVSSYKGKYVITTLRRTKFFLNTLKGFMCIGRFDASGEII